MLELLRRYAYTLWYLRSKQVTGRIIERFKQQFGLPIVPDAPANLTGALQASVSFPTHDSWNTRSDLLKGEFCFLNESKVLGRPVYSHDRELGSSLWQFNLHYFNYLHLLDPGEQEALCREWIAALSTGGDRAGWHPYPTSLRIINWCKAGMQAPDLLESLYLQSAYLYRHLETYLLGNHLLENARALIFAGHFFKEQGEAGKWLAKGLKLYREQTPEQVLPDGGHFERSPMYHSLVLEGFLDVLNLLPQAHADWPLFADSAERMVDFLAAMTHPHGHVSLFNDSTQEIALPPTVLLGYARDVAGLVPRERSVFADTGYFVCRNKKNYFVVDGAPLGPDYLLAHSHADIFSYELSLEGLPFIVDCGVYEYENGPLRDCVRSTPAHNTICIDGVDQAECWDSFRVARRFEPHEVRFEQEASGRRFSGRFDGYKSLIGDGIRHRREIHVDEHVRHISISDTITGRKTHDVRSYVHLHPDVELQRDGDEWILQRDGIGCVLKANVEVKVQEGWYCPEFGKRIRNQVLSLGKHDSLPTQIIYHINQI